MPIEMYQWAFFIVRLLNLRHVVKRSCSVIDVLAVPGYYELQMIKLYYLSSYKVENVVMAYLDIAVKVMRQMNKGSTTTITAALTSVADLMKEPEFHRWMLFREFRLTRSFPYCRREKVIRIKDVINELRAN
jgi:hypothetical protein